MAKFYGERLLGSSFLGDSLLLWYAFPYVVTSFDKRPQILISLWRTLLCILELGRLLCLLLRRERSQEP